MDSKRFRLALLWRLSLIGLTLGLLIYLALKGSYWATCFALSVLLVVQSWYLLKFMEKLHSEVDYFFQALTYNDSSRRFTSSNGARVNAELAAKFEAIQTHLQAQNQKYQEQLHYYSLLLEKVPTALVVFDEDESLQMINIAAQRLFHGTHFASARSLRANDEDFSTELLNIAPGQKRTSYLKVNGISCSMVLTCATLRLAGEEKKVVSIHPIQQELDSQEIQAWQNLVQVFAHEIMNSMTPVTSLSQTASLLLSELNSELKHLDTDEKLADASQAITTLARRTEHLMQFVQAYQRIANPPLLQKAEVEIRAIFNDISRLFHEAAERQAVNIEIRISPETLRFSLDRVQVEQAIINLVKNALEALNGCPAGKICLTAYIGKEGNLVIDVIDNGRGIHARKREQIFVPFYTTKAEGSGIGLFLVKQVMQAHHGDVHALARDEGGAIFRLSFS